MPEVVVSRPRAIALVVASVALALCAGLPMPLAALGALLAQPLAALAVSAWQGDARVAPLKHGGAALGLWAAATVGTGALLAWPLGALLRSGSLSAAIAVSLAVGIALLLLWPAWPVWSGVERDGDWRGHREALQQTDRGAWRGLGVASGVLAIATSTVLLAWPHLLDGAMRWSVAAILALGAPLVHAGIQLAARPSRPRIARREPERATQIAEAVATPAPVDTPPDPQALARELFDAARGGRVERALALVDAGADVRALPAPGDRDQRSLPVLAAVLPDLRLLRALIAKGVDLNAAHAGMSPLLAATRDSWHGRPEAVMTLLSNGADPRQRDGEGNTALHFAARSTDPGVAALLRDAAAELEVVNDEGLSPLGMACAAGNWRVARFLLERGAKPEPPGGQPALLAAAGSEDDDPAGVQLLLKSRARVDARDRQGRSALHVAAFAGHMEIVAALLEAGADPALTDALGRTAVMEAVRGGHLEVADELLRQLPDGGASQAARMDADGRGLLSLACESDRATPELVARLLELGADPAQVDRQGKRPVDRAAEAGRWSLVAALDAGYRLPAALRDEDDDAPLPDRTPLALLREGLQAGRRDLDDVAALLSPADLGVLLHDDAIVADPANAEWLLAHGADAYVRDGQGQTALFMLLGRGPAALPTLRRLLDAGVSPSGRGGLARFLAACIGGDAVAARMALELLDRGADPFGPSRGGDPAITLAVRLGWLPLIERLLATGVDLDARDSRGMSALHLAAALGRVDIVKRLVAHGACIELRATDGQTPLGVALAAGRRDIADWLDWRGWPLPRRPLRAQDVPAAATAGDEDAVRRLLDLGLPVNALDRQGCSALLRSAGGGHRAVVELLLKRGADAGLAAQSGATPLSAAVSMRHLDIVDRLVAAGVSLEQRLPGDLTVLMVASALGLPDLAQRLVAAGADVHAVDAQGRNALHCAALYAFTARDRARVVALFDTLALAGVDADLPAQGVTPLLLLLGARAEPGTAADEDVLLAALDALLAQDVRLDARDARGFGPLHLAALHGLSRVVQALLKAGADPDLRDSLNRSPREIALMRGFVDIAAEFAPPGSTRDISMARFLRDR